MNTIALMQNTLAVVQNVMDCKYMMKAYIPQLLLCFCSVFLLAVGVQAQQPKIMQPGNLFHGIRDYREVMPGALYRGGANNGRGPLRRDQLNALCEAGFGTAIYLYKTGFSGPSTIQCTKGSMKYIDEGWEGAGRTAVDQDIYDTIKAKGKPVFVHCWNGIHATGAVSATALMQFCGMSPQKAVQYWKVGVAPKVQYPSVIHNIEDFRPNTKLQLTSEEKAQYCPQF